MGQHSEDISLLDQNTNELSFVFLADSTNPSCSELASLFRRLSGRHPHRFFSVDTAVYSDAPRLFSVSQLPALLSGQNNRFRVLSLVSDPVHIRKQIEAECALQTRISALTSQDTFVLFIKGTPSEPRCKYTRQILPLLQQAEITFTHFDVLSSAEVRQALKSFSGYETYPQLYCKGVFLCGLDSLSKHLHAGTLEALKGAAAGKPL